MPFPIPIAQLASIGMMVVDTAGARALHSIDLAAVAIGGGIQISVVFALVGVLQAVAPVVPTCTARRDDEVANVAAGFWLAIVLLALPGIAVPAPPGCRARAGDHGCRGRGQGSPISRPAGLEFAGPCSIEPFMLCNALGKPRVLMGIGLVQPGVHAVLAWGWPCRAGWASRSGGRLRLSNVLVARLACLSGALYLAFGPWRVIALCQLGHAAGRDWRELLPGCRWALSNLVEITLHADQPVHRVAWATVVAGHRIVANLSALTYMLPLSLAIATMAALRQAVGARDRAGVQRSAPDCGWPDVHRWSAAVCGWRLGRWLPPTPMIRCGLRWPSAGRLASPSISFSMPCRRLPAIACAPIGSPSCPCWCRPSASGESACWAGPGCAIARPRRSVWPVSGWLRWSSGPPPACFCPIAQGTCGHGIDVVIMNFGLIRF